MIKPVDKRTKAYWKRIADEVMAENQRMRDAMKRYGIEDMDLVPESLIEVCQPVSPQMEKELAWKDERIDYLSARVAQKEKQLLDLKMNIEWNNSGGVWRSKYMNLISEVIGIQHKVEDVLEEYND
jgi:hypothetical protein